LALSDSEYLLNLCWISVGSLGISIWSLLDLHGISLISLLDFACACKVSLLALQWISIVSLLDLHVISIGSLSDLYWSSIAVGSLSWRLLNLYCILYFGKYYQFEQRFLKISSIMYAVLHPYGAVGATRVSLSGSRPSASYEFLI